MKIIKLLLLIYSSQTLYDITPTDAIKTITNHDNNTILIDVRTKEELDEIKIEGIINLDFYSEEFEKGLLNLDRDKTYYLICRSGRRSGIATSFMRDNGFKEAYNIKGGMIEWENSNLSLEIKKGHEL
tara:strand:- start:847 stop:1230 length:384 start_codon:yes stop_codon:yes gene_type:complete